MFDHQLCLKRLTLLAHMHRLLIPALNQQWIIKIRCTHTILSEILTLVRGILVEFYF